jgi:hypothetical protein
VEQLGNDIRSVQGKSDEKIKLISRPQARLQEVLARLRQQPSNQVRIEQMHQIADRDNVLLRQVSYQNKLEIGGLLRHEVHAELSGTYPAIRQFLRNLLTKDEALALEAIEFSRSSGSTGVRAQIRLVFFSWP